MSIVESIRKNALGLGIFAVLTAGLIAVTHALTAERIFQNEQKFKAKLLYEIFPLAGESLINNPGILNSKTFYSFSLLSVPEDEPFYTDRLTGDLILPVIAPDGYTESIKLLVGIKPGGVIKGIRVVSHRETPGLGDRIELKKSNWVLQFDGRSLTVPVEERWKVKKDDGDFDQLSGATITPRAVVAAVHRSLEFYKANQALLMGDQ